MHTKTVQFGENMLFINCSASHLARGLVDTDAQVVTHKGGPLPRQIQCFANESAVHGTPLYRHPFDAFLRASGPFRPDDTALVKTLVDVVRGHGRIPSPTQFNHLTVQTYRDGNDHISEHSDKVLDIRPETPILIYSIGAPRVMRFRHKDKDAGHPNIQIVLPHDSLLFLGWHTQRDYYHAINQCQTVEGPRTSYTFRCIHTFLDNDGRLNGPGAELCNETERPSQALLYQFGTDNRSTSRVPVNQIYSPVV